MKWRCEWCGRPHEEDDPPCEDCGHFKFEKAVVQTADPESIDETMEWVCPECDRLHPKNSPPCSRCGNMQLESRSVDWTERMPDTSTDGYLRVGRKYVLLGVLVLLVAASAFVLAPPADDGEPTPPDAPGEAESASGHELALIEVAVLDRIDERRAEEGLDPLARNETLDSIATYHSRTLVDARYGDGSTAESSVAERYSSFGYDCAAEPVETVRVVGWDGTADRPIERFDDEATIGALVADDISASYLGELSAIGIDSHVAPDGSIYVVVTAC